MQKRWVAVAVGVGLLATTSPIWPPPTEAADAEVCDVEAGTGDLDLAFKDLEGKDVTLSAYEGKVLLVDFWATWCGPCKIEIPGFIELYDKYRSQGFEIVGIQTQDDFDKAGAFAKQFKINYPILDGNERDDELQDVFGPIWGLPTTFLVNRDGEICKKHSGFAPKEQFEQEIKALL